MRIFARSLVSVIALAAVSCVSLFDPSSLVNTLRILAVRSDHPTPKPGTDVKLDMLLFDGSEYAHSSDGNNRPVQVTWLSGCFNPLGDVYAECFPLLQPALDALSAGTQSNLVSHDPTFTVHVPENIISGHKNAGHGQVAYGVSLVFYAVCAGQVQVQDTQNKTRPPLRCVADTGREVGEEGFVFGYIPLYSYEEVENNNPVISGAVFDNLPDSKNACKIDADCGVNQACSSQKVCVQVITKCTNCAEHSFAPVLDPANAESDPIASARAGSPRTEKLTAVYYCSSGTIGGNKTINDPILGWQTGFDSRWTPASDLAGEVVLWAIVRDGRGGVAWWTKEVIVR